MRWVGIVAVAQCRKSRQRVKWAMLRFLKHPKVSLSPLATLRRAPQNPDATPIERLLSAAID